MIIILIIYRKKYVHSLLIMLIKFYRFYRRLIIFWRLLNILNFANLFVYIIIIIGIVNRKFIKVQFFLKAGYLLRFFAFSFKVEKFFFQFFYLIFKLRSIKRVRKTKFAKKYHNQICIKQIYITNICLYFITTFYRSFNGEYTYRICLMVMTTSFQHNHLFIFTFWIHKEAFYWLICIIEKVLLTCWGKSLGNYMNLRLI